VTPLWVIDTNVLVSAAITPGGICDRVLQHAVKGTFRIAWDNSLLAEYRDVLGRPRFGLSSSAVRRLLSALPQTGYRKGVSLRLAVPDPDDLMFAAVACATDERVVVTGNPRHFPKAAMRQIGVTVLSPRQALERLDAMAV
jgi:putative PIN family toxin of toxin-antitoxin system